MAEMTDAIIRAQNDQIRALSAFDRHTAIAGSPNVIGYGRFIFRHIVRAKDRE